MKRSLVFSLVGLAALATPAAFAQGRISLDNYNTSGPNVVYADGPFAGAGIRDTSPGTWTIGVFWAAGDVRAGAGNDPTGFGPTSTWANGLALGAGAGSHGTVSAFPLYYGQFTPSDASDFVMPGVTSGNATVVVFAYAGGASYNSAPYRGHSTAFLITPAQGSNFATMLGTAMPGFAVYVPEPSSISLIAVGGLALVTLRRLKK